MKALSWLEYFRQHLLLLPESAAGPAGDRPDDRASLLGDIRSARVREAPRRQSNIPPMKALSWLEYFRQHLLLLPESAACPAGDSPDDRASLVGDNRSARAYEAPLRQSTTSPTKALSWLEYFRRHLLLLPESAAGPVEDRASLLGDNRCARACDAPRRRVSASVWFASGVAVTLLLLAFSSLPGDLWNDPATTSSARNAASFAPLSQEALYSGPVVGLGAPPLSQEAVYSGPRGLNLAARARCQVIYIVGVESSYDLNHGVIPIIEALARRQRDPDTKAGLNGARRTELWGFHGMPPLGDPELVRRVVDESCPDDGRRRVLFKFQSFPSGHEDDRGKYWVRRGEWANMTAEEISVSDEAMSHSTNMTAFLEAYGPYMDIKLVVLHRPFLELLASGRTKDDNFHHDLRVQSNIVRGFTLMLRRFLDANVHDPLTGERLWTLLCVDKIHSRHYKMNNVLKKSRARVLAHLAEFLGWPEGKCTDCWNEWRETRKGPREILDDIGGREVMEALERDMEMLRGVWPPPGEEVAEQQCEV